MNNLSLVSVIIPAYNSAAYIATAIDSVLNQSYSNIEIIVIDDGSSDETPVIVSRYGDRVKYIKQENQGVSAARNNGIRVAQGDYIAFLDSDDSWFPEKLEKQMQVLTEFTQVIAVFANFHIVSIDGVVLERDGISKDYAIFKYENKQLSDLFKSKEHGIYYGNLFVALFQGNFINTCSLVVRKAVIKQCGYFNTELKTQEDYDYWLRLSKIGDIAYISEPLLNRSRHPGQLTSQSQKLQIAQDVVMVIEKYIDDMSGRMNTDQLKKRVREKYKNLALNHLSIGDNHQARGVLYASVKKTGLDSRIMALIIWAFLPFSIATFLRSSLKR